MIYIFQAPLALVYYKTTRQTSNTCGRQYRRLSVWKGDGRPHVDRTVEKKMYYTMVVC